MRTTRLPAALGLLLATALLCQAAPKPELPALDKPQQKWIEKTAPKARDKFSKDVAAALKKHDSPALRELIARWFPECRKQTGEPTGAETGRNTETGKAAAALAKDWAAFAAEARKAGMPSTAGWEALRALKLDDRNKQAAEILGYVERPKHDQYVPQRAAKLISEGKHLWDWGWTTHAPQPLDRDAKPAGDEGDDAHAAWAKARELEYTLVSLRTNLPLAEACEIGQRVDALLECMRARYLLVEGYTEPAWPLKVWVIAKDAEYNQLWAERPEQPGSPFGEYSYLHKVAHVNAENCAQGFEKTVGIAQHESCHAFFHAAFPGQWDRGQATPYGWMMEAVPAAVYYIDPLNPRDGRLAEQLKRKFLKADGTRDEAVQSVLDGKDWLKELNGAASYDESIGHLQAYITGALFTAMAWQDDRLREAFARFTARCMAWKAESGEFEKTLGETPELTKKLKEWLNQ
ncbi:MAG: hypothetical protein H6841_01675 [Planctomycetes bacterium]|nr:hypothetical protein [Planctomycetota bacterium]MCB9935544.1 hypothetical protein [Planctomycetota bacterium]